MIETQTLTASHSPSGTQATIVTWSPAAGEVWYVDQVANQSDGAGGGSSSIDYGAEIWEAGTTVADSEIGDGGPSASVGAREDYRERNAVTLGTYITDAEKLNLFTAVTFTTAATYTVTVQLRRVV